MNVLWLQSTLFIPKTGLRGLQLATLQFALSVLTVVLLVLASICIEFVQMNMLEEASNKLCCKYVWCKIQTICTANLQTPKSEAHIQNTFKTRCTNLLQTRSKPSYCTVCWRLPKAFCPKRKKRNLDIRQP